MKKIFITLTIIVLNFACVIAQEESTDDKLFSFGVRAGLSFPYNCKNSDSNLGFYSELITDFNIKNNLYFRTGLGFRQFNKRWRISPTQYVSPGSYNNSLNKQIANNIFVPLRLAWKLPITENFGLDLETGTYFSYGVGGKTDLKGYDLPTRDTYNSGFDNRYNFGIECGVGVTFKKYYLGFNIIGNNFNREGANFAGAFTAGWSFR